MAAAGNEPVFLELNDGDDVETASRSTPDGAEAAPPGWFSRKRAKTAEPPSPPKRRSSRAAFPIVPRPEDQVATVWSEPTLLEKFAYLFRGRPAAQAGELVENPRYERFKRLLAFAITGYGVSLILHMLLTALLALVVIEAAQSRDLSLLLSNSTDEVVEFDSIDTALDSAGGAEEQLEVPQMQIVDLSPDLVQPALPEELRPKLPAAGQGDGGEEGDDDGAMFAMPTDSGKVVTQGSFSVWTVPEDPDPGQSYLIVIQVKLPDRVTRYRRSDLTGIVIGTDGYRQPIPGITRGWLPVKENTAQLAIRVPGAASLVRDTINVRSKMLNEKQQLEIEF